MAREKMNMPQSSAGLIRYFEDADSAFRIRPEHVVIATVAVIVFEMAMLFIA